MEKIILVQLDGGQERKIRRMAESKKIQVIVIGQGIRDDVTVGQLLDASNQDLVSDSQNKIPGESLVLFSDVSEKHFDKLLFEMRSAKIDVDYKAVVTKTNINWPLCRLFSELDREKRQYQSSIK